jgi:hypothetical protein
VQRERERGKLLEAGSRSKLEVLESTAAASSAQAAASSREAQEALAMERQRSRNLQLEVERLRVAAEVRWGADKQPAAGHERCARCVGAGQLEAPHCVPSTGLG